MKAKDRQIYWNVATRICEDFGIAVTADTLWRLVEIIGQEFEKHDSCECEIPSLASFILCMNCGKPPRS